MAIIPIGKKIAAPVEHFSSCPIGIDSTIPSAHKIIEANVHIIPLAIIKIIIIKFGTLNLVFLFKVLKRKAKTKGITAINNG